MTYRVHWMNTGEIEVSLGVSLLGNGYNPHVPGGQVLPYGYRESFERPDGTMGTGTMVPIPFYYIEGTKKKIIIDTGTNIRNLPGRRKAHRSLWRQAILVPQ